MSGSAGSAGCSGSGAVVSAGWAGSAGFSVGAAVGAAQAVRTITKTVMSDSRIKNGCLFITFDLLILIGSTWLQFVLSGSAFSSDSYSADHLLLLPFQARRLFR
jgi:hypothetical protein